MNVIICVLFNVKTKCSLYAAYYSNKHKSSYNIEHENKIINTAHNFTQLCPVLISISSMSRRPVHTNPGRGHSTSSPLSLSYISNDNNVVRSCY